ncbi:MAG: hypothetical protein WDO70_02660 [Alphaproteobacteria bacterium]
MGELFLPQNDDLAPTRAVARFCKGDFELDGLQVHFAQKRVRGATELHFEAKVGYLPFTVEGHDRRMILLDIIAGASRLDKARFRVDGHSCIVLEADAPVACEASDADIMGALIDFYREARPFLQLIGGHL